MGLAYQIMEGVLREHRYRAITGSVVQIGRQTIELTVPSMMQLFMRYRLPLDAFRDSVIEIDRQTVQVRQSGKRFVTDHAFFGIIGATEVHAVDHSDFEGADIIHDLNRTIPPSLEGIADIILDGSTLDNVHDPAMALMNYNRMLRPGGRVISANAAKPDVQGAYTGMSPEWFLDYYAVNSYRDCRVYAQLDFPAARWCIPSGPVAFLILDYQWMIEHGRAPFLDHEGWAFTIVVAEKDHTSTWDKIPRRARFRTAAEQEQWLAAVKRFSASRRPSFLTNTKSEVSPPAGFVTAQ